MAKEETVLQGMIVKLIEIGRCYGMEMNGMVCFQKIDSDNEHLVPECASPATYYALYQPRIKYRRLLRREKCNLNSSIERFCRWSVCIGLT
jgi:hypothetical protein